MLRSTACLFVISCLVLWGTWTPSRSDGSDTVDPSFVESPPFNGPHTITREILEDRHGNLWFATWQGIIRYDGEGFTNHTLTDNLGRFRAFCILEERDGDLWFGTVGGGAYRYDGKTFAHFTQKDGLAGDQVMALFEDADGNVWFGTDGGVSSYDGERFVTYTTDDGLSDDSVQAIAQDRDRALWFGTGKGLDRFDGRTFTELMNTEGESFSNVRSLMTDRAGALWIGSGGGLTRLEGDALTTISTLSIGDVFEDRSGAIWVSAAVSGLEQGRMPEMGLYRVDGTALILVETSEQVFGLEEDSSGTIWFGTLEGANQIRHPLKDA